MTKEEFSSKYKVRPSEKCCWGCKHAIVYNSGKLECCNPKIDIAMIIDENNICDEWKGWDLK